MCLTWAKLKDGNTIFSHQGIATYTFQKDGKKAHKQMQVLINKWNIEHASSIHLLEAWPLNSPGLNPIQKAWDLTKAKIEALGLKTFKEYQAAALDTVRSVPTEMLRRC